MRDDRVGRERPLRLAVVVPATNRPPTLERCLAAIQAGQPPPDELIVVDQPAIGPAAARNAGALEASCEVVVFVDADIELHRDALARIGARMSADPELTAVFGSYDDMPPNGGAVSVFRNLLHHHTHQEAAGPASTFWSGIGAIRRQDFLNAGGFDASRFTRASIEDIELGMRLVAAGLRVELDPRIQGTHLKRWTFGSMVYTDLFHRGVPWVELLLSRGTHTTALNLGWRHRASMICATVAAVAIVRRRFPGCRGDRRLRNPERPLLPPAPPEAAGQPLATRDPAACRSPPNGGGGDRTRTRAACKAPRTRARVEVS